MNIKMYKEKTKSKNKIKKVTLSPEEIITDYLKYNHSKVQQNSDRKNHNAVKGNISIENQKSIETNRKFFSKNFLNRKNK